MGKFIVIEGLDGSGKSTQGEMLRKYLQGKDIKSRILSFPAYNTPGCTLVEMYLGGALGDKPSDTNGYAASMFFAADRYVSYVTDWRKDYLSADTVLISTRYTTSNAYHQLSKLPREEWDSFLSWLIDFEFNKLGLPKPDKVILLEMPQSFSSSQVEKRTSETGAEKDIHEKDTEYLSKCYEAALYTANKLGWDIISCAPHGVQLTRDEVFKILCEKIEL